MKEQLFDEIFPLVNALEEITDYDETLRMIANHAGKLFNADEASVLMINPRTNNTVKTIFSEKRDDKSININLIHNLVTGWILKNKMSFVSSDNVLNDSIAEEIKGVSIISAPLKYMSKIIGVIFLMKGNTESTYAQDDLIKLESYCSVVSPFLANTQNIYQYFTPSLTKDSLVAKFNELGMIGSSQNLIEVMKGIDTAAKCSVRVMIQGKSGTGKELVAKAIHKLSDRADKNYVAIDCGAMPAHLIESELFGHVKGAFTGADTSRKGLIEEADGGTLFMDEITNLPIETQSKLLRVLQENEIRPLGSNQSKKVDVRIITASSSSINDIVAKGDFREDLFYRLFVYPIYLPSLNERKDDIPLLAEYFLKKYSAEQKKAITGFSDDAMSALINHDWKGNIRELENYIERIVAQVDVNKSEIELEDIPLDIKNETTDTINSNSLVEQMLNYETQIIRDALNSAGWNQSEAARSLGIPEQTLRYKMKKLNITKNLTDYS